MHPLISKALVAERAGDLKVHAAAARRAREIRRLRRAQQTRRARPFRGIPRPVGRPKRLTAAEPLQDPATA
jgi:hypothetical protein